jgi:murein DD-endopeptidase MepM/ murein hydrolase activator NlpD
MNVGKILITEDRSFYRVFLAAILLLITEGGVANAQSFMPVKQYPQQYFQWPVGAIKALVANFGELRANHYHMGLDCRTEQVENKPILAAADGYIAKVKIEPWGFGRALYVNHPNGMTTLYAHLNDFYPALEKYIKEQQYKMESWELFMDLPADLFPVEKGMLIAYSGNTGGSQGPHLHFEIRDTKTDKVLNPLLMGFPIPDNIAPDVLRLAVYDRSQSTYEQTPKIYPLKKVNGVYMPVGGKISINTQKVSFAITAWDRYTGSTNQNGIYEAVLYDNNKPVIGFQMNNISYLETRYLNAHIDFKLRASGGPYLQHLSKLPGNHDVIYTSNGSDGVLQLGADDARNIRIQVADPNGNSSTIKFEINSTGLSAIRKNIPAQTQQTFHPGFFNIFENDQVQFHLPPNAIYDSFHFNYKQTKDVNGQPIYQLHQATVPVHTYFPISIKGWFSMVDTGKVVMYRYYESRKDYKKAHYHNGWYKASFREFGNYQLLLDTIPPSIRPVGFTNNMNTAKLSRLLFVVEDDTEEIDDFTATLNGKWIRFSNDKGRNFIYKFDEYCGPGSHELVITATDQVGNTSTKTYQFTR